MTLISLDWETSRKRGNFPNLHSTESRRLGLTYFYSWGLRFLLLKTELCDCLSAQSDTPGAKAEHGQFPKAGSGGAWPSLGLDLGSEGRSSWLTPKWQ